MKNSLGLSLPPEYSPDLATAEARYPVIFEAIKKYSDELDGQGMTYEALQRQLETLTGKNLASFDLHEWWEGEGLEVLSFRIALPDPVQTTRQMRRDEVQEIIHFLTTPLHTIENATDPCKPGDCAPRFLNLFFPYLTDWYHALLAMNAPQYHQKWFLRQKDPQGKWFEYTPEALTKRVMGEPVPLPDKH